MPLAAGTRLGPYEVLALLGSGAMGEVYRARDSRLNREVAVKTLPPSFALDPERQRRFEHEARAAGHLNHPNIMAIYDVGSSDGVPFVVAELLQGETLRTRLKSGSLPISRAIDYGLQIARGLAAAHEHGIIHRDLKPENLFVTKDGRVKILDFGLAKLTHPETRARGEGDSLAGSLTETGAIVGTAGYMAPEQVRGEKTDHRADLFALGAILYEMVSGQRAFHGDSSVATLYAIMNDEPPLPSSLGRPVPPALERLIAHSLEKHAEARFQSARDIAFSLEGMSDSATVGVSAGHAIAPSRRWRPMAAGGLVALMMVTALITNRLSRPHINADPVLFSVPAPQATLWDLGFSLSPDGQSLAYGDHDSTGFTIYIRPLASQIRRVLEGAQKGVFPFWSPDSRFIAFFNDVGKLMRVSASGGNAQVICDARVGCGGTWNRQGIIVFENGTEGPLYRVSATGGKPLQVTTLDTTSHEIAHRWPCFLPDGRHFIYTVAPPHNGEWDCYVGSLDSHERKLLLSASSAPVYAAPGYLLYRHHDKLMAQRFDPRRERLEGQPNAVSELITGPYGGFGQPTAFAARNGELACLSSPPANTLMVWLDRRGTPIDTVDAPPGRYDWVAVAPDNRRIAASRMDAIGNRDIWVIDPTQVASRLTFGPDPSTSPIWSRDGKRVYFTVYGDRGSIYQRPADGSQPAELVFRPDANWAAATSESPDGRYLVIIMPLSGGNLYYWLLPRFGARTPTPFVAASPNGSGCDVSPDGQWATYSSDESGTTEAYVQSFPILGKKFQISFGGGVGPAWAAGGRLIQYATLTDKIMEVDVRTSPIFQFGRPHLMGRVNKDWSCAARPDGQGSLACVPAGEAPASTFAILLNWTATLKR